MAYYSFKYVTLAIVLASASSITLALRATAQPGQVGRLSEQADRFAQNNGDEFEYEDFEFWAEQCLLLRDEHSRDSEALAACEAAISLEPDEDNVELWAARGDILFRLGQYVESLVSYNRVIEVSPNYSSVITLQCASLYHLQRYEDAVDRCERALRTDGNWGTRSPALAWFYRGLSLKQLGRLETALASFESALRIEPDDPQASAARCNILSELGNIQVFTTDCAALDTITLYERAIAEDIGNAELWIQQGLALEHLGVEESIYQRALTSYERALELNSANSVAAARRCAVLNQLEQYEAALESCEQAFQGDNRWGDGGLVHVWNQHSHALVGLGRFEEALASADRAIAIDANYAPAWNSRAVCLWRLDPWNPEVLTSIDQAIRLYAESEELLEDTFERTYPDPPVVFYRGQIFAWFNKGRFLSSIVRDEAAIQAYRQALIINELVNLRGIKPLNEVTIASIWANLSAAYLTIDVEQTLTTSQQAIDLDHHSFAGWYNQAVALTQLERFNEALYAYTQAEQVNPNNLDVLVGRGIALAGSGQTQAAIEVFNLVLNLDPNQEAAQQHLDRLVNAMEYGQ